MGSEVEVGPRIMGLDLSLTNPGWAIIEMVQPDAEGLPDFRIIHTASFKTTISDAANEAQQLERMMQIAERIARDAHDFDVREVWMEGGAFNQMGRLFHLGGLHYLVQYVVRKQILVQPRTITASKARKLVFGCAPTRKGVGDVKRWISRSLVSRFGRFMDWTADEHVNDALVVALAARHRFGPCWVGDPMPPAAEGQGRRKRQAAQDIKDAVADDSGETPLFPQEVERTKRRNRSRLQS